MIPILGYLYFGQDAWLRTTRPASNGRDRDPLSAREGYRNVIIELNNDGKIRYDHPILRCDRVHEPIDRVKTIEHGVARSA